MSIKKYAAPIIFGGIGAIGGFAGGIVLMAKLIKEADGPLLTAIKDGVIESVDKAMFGYQRHPKRTADRYHTYTPPRYNYNKPIYYKSIGHREAQSFVDNNLSCLCFSDYGGYDTAIHVIGNINDYFIKNSTDRISIREVVAIIKECTKGFEPDEYTDNGWLEDPDAAFKQKYGWTCESKSGKLLDDKDIDVVNINHVFIDFPEVEALK